MAPRWLHLVLIVNMPIIFAAAGPPEPPSKPECSIPCDDSCGVDIHCSWNHKFDTMVPTNYSLHWETEQHIKGHVNTGTCMNGLIDREHFSMNSELYVWVLAENKHGSAKSQVEVFNTGDIMKPSPPIISWRPQDPLEISWSSICTEPHLSLGSCDVQFRTEGEKLWHEDEVGAQVSYEFSGLVQAGIVYEFRVRCSCATGLISDWSAIQRICSETAPTGQVDVWRDCGMFATNINCVMTWKKLPPSQACGPILGYEVTLFSEHSMTLLVNVSITEPRAWVVCDKMQCYLNSSLTNVSSASISAYNAHGATDASSLTSPTPGKVRSEQAIDVRMNIANLTVSWDLPSLLPDPKSIKEFVVQYKQVGSPFGKGFDWIRVNKSCTTVTFIDHFEKYRPYEVSMFTVTSEQQSHHISSVIAYSFHGIPAKVRSLRVISIGATQATLFWEPVPLTMQNGLILYYEIGVQGQMAVCNVSAYPQDKNKTFEVTKLSPYQEYEVWIKAVTEAGPGANVTASFITKQQEHLQLKSKSHMFALLLLLCLPVIICFLFILFSFHKGTSKTCLCINEKVPDPYNSTIFEMMKYQVNEPLAWICVPINEPHTTMSMLEVVEIQRPVCGQKCFFEEQTKPAVASEGCTRRAHGSGRDGYSKIFDSEEEKDVSGVAGRDTGWSSSEEEATSGYEQHFMPPSVEIMKEDASGYEQRFMPPSVEIMKEDASGYEQHFMPTPGELIDA